MLKLSPRFPDRLFGSDGLIKWVKQILIFWPVVTIIVLFMVRINKNTESWLFEYAYPTMGAMFLILVLFLIASSRYRRDVVVFRYNVRERLRATDFEENSAEVIAGLIPTYRFMFFLKFMQVVLIVFTTYILWLFISVQIRWLILFFGTGLAGWWYKNMIQTRTDKVIKRAQII